MNPMNMVVDEGELKKKLEAILFAAGRKVEVEEIARLLKLKDLELIKVAIEALKHEYDDKNSPLLLTPEGTGWKLTVREKYLALVREISPHTELAKALLETLAVVAWKQPVLQSDVIKIRSTAAYEHIASLLELGFIHREKKGRSYMLKVTGKFFDYFDLPDDQKAINEVFKDVTSAAEILQQQLGQKGEQKTFGAMPVYEAGVSEAQKPEHPAEEKLGALDVYDEPNQDDAQMQKTDAAKEAGSVSEQEDAETSQDEGQEDKEPREEDAKEEQENEEENSDAEKDPEMDTPKEDTDEDQAGETTQDQEDTEPSKDETSDAPDEDTDGSGRK